MAKGILIYEDFLALPIEKKIAFLEASQEAAVILSHVAEKLRCKPDQIIHKLRAVMSENTELKKQVKGLKDENKRTKTRGKNESTKGRVKRKA